MVVVVVDDVNARRHFCFYYYDAQKKAKISQ